ncbi:hypothetical protein [Sphingobium sp. WCS2017Hpa-17]|uniref:hypothetical protein n=1 Tax=Sphingobium sp. WCS2017Hpa-17 TaxID=3073638 RepID=UPI00288C3CDF|nr:hypothetical protein [Sphingobium sp. WCS2017Hpa-17]
MNPSDLAEIFRTRLGATQPKLQIELFDADLMRSNLDLMDASLKEARAIAVRAGAPQNARDAVMALYNVKLAELSQLFPIFFLFESAFRTFTAARLKAIYGDDQWWRPIRDALTMNRDLRRLHRLGNLPARRDVVDTVAHLLNGMGRGAARVTTSYDLLEGGTLAHVERLIASHWSAVDQALRHNPTQAKLTGTTFNNLFKLVRNARNDAYHHRSVQHRARVVVIVEQLLDLLDMSLTLHVTAVEKAPIAKLNFSIAVEPRHG